MRLSAVTLALFCACTSAPRDHREATVAPKPAAVEPAAPTAVEPAAPAAHVDRPTATLIASLTSPSAAAAAILPWAGVLQVDGAVEDPSDAKRGGDAPRAFHARCRADAERAIAAFAKAMVDHARRTGDPIECDEQFLDRDDPDFGAVAAQPGVKARPGRPFRYAVCTAHGVAEYDRSLSMYFRREAGRGLVVLGTVDSEVGSIFVDEDHGILAHELSAQVMRCP